MPIKRECEDTMMKKRKSLIVALSSLALIATSIGTSGFKTYADENIGNFDTYTEADSKENSTDTITAYATSAKKKLTLRLERRDGNVQEISLGEHYDQGSNPNYYFSSINPIFSQYRAVVTHLSSGDDGGYILHAKEPGNLIVKDAKDPSPSNNQVIPYEVKTPTVSNPQTVTYTLPRLDDSDFYYQKTKADGGTEDINYDEDNRTFTLTGDERFTDTIVTIYSKGTKGLAETIQPIKKELMNKEDNIPTLENLLSCLDFGNDENMWLAIENPFANEKLGQAKFSWFRFDKDGNMLTNWQWIKDEKDGKFKCYYLNPISNGSMGAMLSNTRTPDGFTVNAAGEWVVNGIVQTK